MCVHIRTQNQVLRKDKRCSKQSRKQKIKYMKMENQNLLNLFIKNIILLIFNF